MDEQQPREAAPSQTAPSSAAGRKRTLSRGAAYTVALAGPRALQLLTLPLFVYAMTAAEFGRMALAVAVTLAVVPLLTRPLETAVFRSWYVLAGDEEDRRRYVSTAAVTLLVLPIVLALLVLLVTLPYTSSSDKLPTSYLALALCAGATQISATIVPLSALRAQDRLRDFLRISLTGPVVSLPLMALMVAGFGWGARGWLAANLIGALVTLPVAALALREQWTRRLSRTHLRAIVKWVVPSVPHGMAHWTLGTSDRLILASWVSLTDLGVYNIGYQLAMVLTLFYSALNYVYSSDYGRAINDAVHRAGLARIVTNQVFATAALGLVVALLAPPAIAVLLPAEFGPAQAIVPWVALGYVFYGLYFVPMNRIVLLGGDIGRIWVATSIAAVTNVGLNLALVPSGGIVAAAINTAVSYFVMLVIVCLYARHYHPMPGGVAWGTIVLIVGGLAAVYAVAVVVRPDDDVLTFCWRLGCLVACGLAVLGYRYARPQAPAQALQ